jgi:hypothetical protein
MYTYRWKHLKESDNHWCFSQKEIVKQIVGFLPVAFRQSLQNKKECLMGGLCDVSWAVLNFNCLPTVKFILGHKYTFS